MAEKATAPQFEASIFIPITKVDVSRREVWGVAAEERVDKSDEVFDYAGSRPLFEEWSKSFADATEGKSLGNIRAMHGATAAGKVIAMNFDDDQKRILVGAKIVDDQEWRKVEEGVYTGYSIGGKYIKRWQDETNKGATRYVARPHEISLVDNPCMHGATFTAIKADGAEELRKFVGEIVETEQPQSVEKFDASYYGSNEIADARMALDALAIVETLLTLESGESHAEPPEQKTQLLAVIQNLKAFVASEITESVEDEKAAAVESVDLQKVDWQAQHDDAVKNGATCSAEKSVEAEPVAAVEAAVEKIDAEPSSVAKLVDRLEALAVEVTSLKADNATKAEEASMLRKQVDDLKAGVAKVSKTIVEPGAPVYKGANGEPSSNPSSLAPAVDASSLSVERIAELAKQHGANEETFKLILHRELAVEMTKRALTRSR